MTSAHQIVISRQISAVICFKYMLIWQIQLCFMRNARMTLIVVLFISVIQRPVNATNDVGLLDPIAVRVLIGFYLFTSPVWVVSWKYYKHATGILLLPIKFMKNPGIILSKILNNSYILLHFVEDLLKNVEILVTIYDVFPSSSESVLKNSSEI